ncbi:MAG: YHYH protein [Reyranellaceae bacterium]
MEALSGARPLGIDQNKAHVQPDGSYHYHGLPTGLIDRLGGRGMGLLVGWAADGFPIDVDEAAPRCFVGAPDASFVKRGLPPGPPGPPPRR